MRKILYSILCTLAVFLASCTKENKLIALDGRMETSAILSSDEVKTFVQNFDGRMWIGTSYGLNLYDGQSFTSFYFNNNDTTTIPDNSILKLFRDRQNRIWIGTHHGLALYDGNGRFRRFHPDKGEDNDVREIVQLSDGRIIAKSGTVGTSSNVFQVDAQSNRMHLIYHTRSYLSICAGERGELWLIDPCNIRQTDSLYHTIRTITTGQKGMVCFSVQTTDNKMWVTQENRFTGIDLHTGKIYRPTEMIKEPITYIKTYDDHTIVLKTHTQWLMTDTRTKALRAAASLGETDIHQVTNIYRDASHNLWIGYYNSGFEVVNPYRSLLQQHNANPLTTLTAGNRIACLAYSNGLLWCGTYSEDFDRPKIIWGNLNLKGAYSYAPKGMFINAPSSFIATNNIAILHILNSPIADYYIRSLGVTRNGGYFEYKPMFVEKLPVPQTGLDKLMSYPTQPSQKQEQVMAAIIYQLYGLSQQEIDYLENREL